MEKDSKVDPFGGSPSVFKLRRGSTDTMPTNSSGPFDMNAIRTRFLN
jgi:hypothetical protein